MAFLLIKVLSRKNGSFSLDARYTYTSFDLTNHEDFTSYYPNMLRMMDAFFNEGGDFYAAREKYTAEAGYKNTSAALDPLGDEIEETGLSDYNLSTDRINEIISSLPTVIKTGVQADWDALVASGDKIAGDGIDISILFTGIGENGNYEGLYRMV